MLRAFQQFIHDFDCDVITGYNIIRFDFDYLMKRANLLGIDRWAQFGRMTGVVSGLPTAIMWKTKRGETKDINHQI